MEDDEWRDKVEAGKKALLAYQKKKKTKKKKAGIENLPEGQATSSGADETSLSLTTQSLDDISDPNLTDDHLEVCDPLPTGAGSGPVTEVPSQQDNQDAELLTIQETFSSPVLPSDSGLGIPSTGEMKGTQQRVQEVFGTDRFLEQEQPLYPDGSDATQVHSQSLEQSQTDDKQRDSEKEMLKLQIDALHTSYAEKMEVCRKQCEEAANAQVQGIYASLQENLQLQQKQSQEAQSALLSRLDQEQSLRKAAEAKISALEAEMLQNAVHMTLTPSVSDMEEIKQKLQAVSSERDHLRIDLEAARQEMESTLQASTHEKAQMRVQLAEQIEEAKKSSFSQLEAQFRAVTMQLEESQRREAQIRSSFDALHTQQSDLLQKSQDSAELVQECQTLRDSVKHWESRVKDLELSHAQEISDLQQDFQNRLSDAKGLLEVEHQRLISQMVKEKEESLKLVILKLEKQLEEERLNVQELEASISQLSSREAQVVDLEETNEGLMSQLESLNYRLEETEMQHRTLSSEKEGLVRKHADLVQGLKRQQLEIEEGIQAYNEVQQQKHQLELEVQSLQAALKAQAVPRPTLTSSEVSADNLFNLLSLKVDSALQKHLHHIGFDFEAGPESLFANLHSFIHAKSQEVTDLELELKKLHAVTDKTIQELTAENTTLKQDIASLHNESTKPQSQLQMLTEDRSALESSLVKQRGILRQKLAEKDNLEQQLRCQRAELDQQQARQSHLEALLEEKNRMEQELQSQKDILLGSLANVQERLRVSEEDAVEQQKRWEEERSKAQSTLKQKEEALSQQQSEFHSQKVALTAQYDGYIYKLQEDHSKQVKTIEEEAATSLKQREVQLVQHQKEEIGRLTSQHDANMQDMRRQHSQELAKKDQLLEQLEAKLADSVRAMVLLQKESQEQADAALAKLQQSLNAVHLEEVRKVKEELGLAKEKAVEDLTKQCHAARDEYNQLKAVSEEECLALQEQLQVFQETAKTVEAVKTERDEALRQLREVSQTRKADFHEMKQTSESQLKALQVQHASEVEQLQHQLDEAKTRIEELHLIHEEQTLAQTKLQTEVIERTAECARLKELSAVAANRSEDETQRNNEVVLLRKDNEDLQNQLSAWKEKVSSFQGAVAMYEQKVAELHQLATDVDDEEELGSNGSTISESSSIEEHSLVEPSVQTLQDTAHFTEEQLQPDDTTLQSGFIMDISKGSLSMEAPGLDLLAKLERVQQVMKNVAHRHKKLAKKDQLLEQLEAKLADSVRAMALMQKESQQQADAALAKLQQSLDAVHLEEVRKVEEELGLEKEKAVEDLTKQCQAARDEYNQLKSVSEEECLALQEQLQVFQETAKTVEAVKTERDEALRQLREVSQTREADFHEMKQTSESQLKALQVQHALEVEQLQHQLDEAKERVTELDRELKGRANVTYQMESLLEEEKKEHHLLSTQLASVIAEKERCLQEMSELQSKLHSIQSLEQSAGDFALLESESYAVVDLNLLNRIRELAPSLRSESAEVHALSDLQDSLRELKPSTLERELAGLMQAMQEALAHYPQSDSEAHDWKKEFLDAIEKFLREEHKALSKLIASTNAPPKVPTGKEYTDLLSHLETQTENMQALHQVDRTALLAENHELRDTVASLQKGHTDQLCGLQAQLTEACAKAYSLESTCAQQKEALRQEKDRSAEDLNEIQLALQVEERRYKDLNDRFIQKEQQMQQQALEIGQELSKKHTELHRCTHELVTARNEIFRLQEELNTQQLELQSTLSQLAATRSQGLAQQEEYGRIQAKLRRCQRDLSSAHEHGARWQEQVQQQQSELNRTSEDLRSAQSEILDLKRQVRFHHSPFLSGQSSPRVPEDAWQEPQRAGFGAELQGSLVLPSTEGSAHVKGLAGMESGMHSATQSLRQMKAELSRIHALYKRTENQRRALVFQKAYLTQQVDSFYYTQHAAFDILQEMHLVDVAALHSRSAVHTPRQHFRAIVWGVIAVIRIRRLFLKHK